MSEEINVFNTLGSRYSIYMTRIKLYRVCEVSAINISTRLRQNNNTLFGNFEKGEVRAIARFILEICEIC